MGSHPLTRLLLLAQNKAKYLFVLALLATVVSFLHATIHGVEIFRKYGESGISPTLFPMHRRDEILAAPDVFPFTTVSDESKSLYDVILHNLTHHGGNVLDAAELAFQYAGLQSHAHDWRADASRRPCRSLHAVLPSVKGSGDLALLLVTPVSGMGKSDKLQQASSSSPLHHAASDAALALSSLVALVSYYRTMSPLSRDLIWLVTDAACDTHAAMDVFLTMYAPEPSQLAATAVRHASFPRGGVLSEALVLDLMTSSTLSSSSYQAYLNPFGAGSILPNHDLFALVSSAAMRPMGPAPGAWAEHQGDGKPPTLSIGHPVLTKFDQGGEGLPYASIPFFDAAPRTALGKWIRSRVIPLLASGLGSLLESFIALQVPSATASAVQARIYQRILLTARTLVHAQSPAWLLDSLARGTSGDSVGGRTGLPGHVPLLERGVDALSLHLVSSPSSNLFDSARFVVGVVDGTLRPLDLLHQRLHNADSTYLPLTATEFLPLLWYMAPLLCLLAAIVLGGIALHEAARPIVVMSGVVGTASLVSSPSPPPPSPSPSPSPSSPPSTASLHAAQREWQRSVALLSAGLLVLMAAPGLGWLAAYNWALATLCAAAVSLLAGLILLCVSWPSKTPLVMQTLSWVLLSILMTHVWLEFFQV